MGPQIVPCLWLDDQAEQAAELYTRVFGGRILDASRYPESFDNPSRRPRGSVATVEFELRGRRFTALNGGPVFRINPSISFFVYTDSAAQTDELCATLGEGGRFMIPPGRYPWSERYGWVEDRFSVSWQVMTNPRPAGSAGIVPCLMFADAQHGQAEAAIKAYTAIFPDSRIDTIQRYGADRGPEGKVVHGRFVLAGQDFTAMDSHEARGATFNEAVSFRVLCEDQREIDRYWASLSEGGCANACGWLKDSFGLSWQVVPRRISALLASPDTQANERAFRAVLEMRKLDIEKLDAAFAAR